MRKILFQEADFYGASKLIFIDEPTPICYRATWMHGLGFVFHDNIDHKILIHYNEDNLPIHLVNNSESVELLNSEGVSSIAVGMPYIYTKAYTNNQRQKILYKRVFMPGHIISGVNIKHDYSKWKNIISKYDCDAICLAGAEYNDVINSNISFGNVEIIQGASAVDYGSLERVSTMFFSTEEIITNAIGSHIVYAAASGVRIRIIDEIKDGIKQGPEIVKQVPLKLRKSFQNYYRNNILDKLLSSIWFSDNDAEIKEYSEYLLGVEHKKSIDVMKNYLTPINKLQKMSIMSNLLFTKIINKLDHWKKLY